MELPTATEVRTRSELLTDAFPPGADPDPLEPVIADAGALVSALTWRLIPNDATPDGASGEDVTPGLEPIAVRAVTLKAEQLAVRSSSRARKKAITDGRLQSFTAGPYSESYFGPGEAQKAKMLDPDAALAEVLWDLATQAARDYWIAEWTGVRQPASAVVAYDYSRRPGSGNVPWWS